MPLPGGVTPSSIKTSLHNTALGGRLRWSCGSYVLDSLQLYMARYLALQGNLIMQISESQITEAQEKWQIQLRKGALELVILAALREKPVYGLALLRHLQCFPTTAITEGTLYPLLDRLRREELVSAEWIHEEENRPRKYYQLTSKGRQKLAALTLAWRQSVADIDALLVKSPDDMHSNPSR